MDHSFIDHAPSIGRSTSNNLPYFFTGSKDPVVEKAAIAAIAEAKNDEAVGAFVKAIKYLDDKVERGKDTRRNQACIIEEIIEGLVHIGQPSVEPLVRVLTGRRYEYRDRLRRCAQRALVSIGEPSVQPLIQTVRGAESARKSLPFYGPDGDFWGFKRLGISDTLIRIGEPSIGGLCEVLESARDNTVYRWAEITLCYIGEMRVTRYVLEKVKQETVKHGNWGDRQSPIECVLQLYKGYEMPRLSASLILALRDRNPVVRSNAAVVLGVMEERKGVGPLIHCLEDTMSDVRKSAARALGEIGSKAAILPLTQTHRREEDRSVRKVVDEALRRVEEREGMSQPYGRPPRIAFFGV